ncbi:MAG: hypothetical protein ACYSTY_07415 [Planctomycetota bacterium]
MPERRVGRSSGTSHDRSTRATARRRGDLAPITYRRVPLLEPETKLLAMGSCFAVEIRQALRERGLPVMPDLARLEPRFAQLLTYMAPDGLTPLTPQIADRYVLQWYFTATSNGGPTHWMTTS